MQHHATYFLVIVVNEIVALDISRNAIKVQSRGKGYVGLLVLSNKIVALFISKNDEEMP